MLYLARSKTQIIMKKLLFIFTILAIGLVSCKKRGPQGIEGEKGTPGVIGVNQEKQITFLPGDMEQLFGSFPEFEVTDVILTYIHYGEINGAYLWTQIPYFSSSMGINFVPFFSETTGKLWIGVQRTDGGGGSPIFATKSIYFRAIHIKGHAIKENPNVDFSNYEEVTKVFNVVE